MYLTEQATDENLPQKKQNRTGCAAKIPALRLELRRF